MTIVKVFSGRFMIRGGGHGRNPFESKQTQLEDHSELHPVLASSVGLSFWGGVDPITGIVIDASHPLFGICVTNTILCLPSGRGSCTASQVILELIRNRAAPRAIILRDVDGLVAVGALVAQEVFGFGREQIVNDGKTILPVLDIIHLGTSKFRQLLEISSSDQRLVGSVTNDGNLVVGTDSRNAETIIRALTSLPPSCVISSSTSNEFSLLDTENKLLQNTSTEAEKIALRVIFRYARILLMNNTENPSLDPSSIEYLPVEGAHIDACTYIGPGGLELVKLLVTAGGRVRVPTTLNAGSTDRHRWKSLQVRSDYAQNAIALGDAYLTIGCQPTFTCAPYLLALQSSARDEKKTAVSPSLFPNVPLQFGSHLVWGESNAVVYANSVIGARTEKYADFLDICGAIAGVIPAAGVHLDANREPTLVLDARDLFDRHLNQLFRDEDAEYTDSLFPILGHVCGKLSDGQVPILLGMEKIAAHVTLDTLKGFCAAFGTTAASPLIHIAGITPEAMDPVNVQTWVDQCKSEDKHLITLQHINDTYLAFNSGEKATSERIDLVALGNPHLSISECKRLVTIIEQRTQIEPTADGSRKNNEVRMIACMSRTLYDEAESKGYIKKLKDFGTEFINDTCWCMLLDPPIIPANKKATILTNSGKYAHYGPALTHRSFRYGSLSDCVSAAVSGVFRRSPTSGPFDHRRTNIPWLSRPQGSCIRHFHLVPQIVAVIVSIRIFR
jgi:cis-L-3-hydroxyproline dehydratase